MKSNQSGAAHLVAVLGIIVIVVIGFVGWRVMQANKDKKTNTSVSSESSTTTAVKTKVSVQKEGALVLPNGYADPTVVATASGYRMYVNRQSGGPNGILIFASTDGVTWTKEKDIILPGTSTSRAVIFPDGVRLYYPEQQPINEGAPTANMISSFSTDGLTFTKDPGLRLSPRSNASYVEGPTVFQLADKTWRMYFNENTVAAKMQRDGVIWGATSKDGVTWTRDEATTIEAGEEESMQGNMKAPWKQVLHPFVLKNPKGGYIMFYNSHSEIYAATSTDGLKWSKIGKIGIHGADFDGYFQKDGTIRAYYGDFSPQTGGLVYMAVLKVE